MMTLGIADAFLKKAYGALMLQPCGVIDKINLNYSKVDQWPTSIFEGQAF